MNAELNKKHLLDLYAAVVGKDWPAVRSLLSEDFVDHNPGIAPGPGQTGRDAFIAYFQAGSTPLDGAQVDIKTIVCDDAFAVVHYKLVNAAHPQGMAVVDIFKASPRGFCEHWDVLQAIPAVSANPVAMF